MGALTIACAGAVIVFSQLGRERSAIEAALILAARAENTNRQTNEIWSERGPLIYRNVHPTFHPDGTVSVSVQRFQPGSVIWDTCDVLLEMTKRPDGWRVIAARKISCSAPLTPDRVLRRQYFQPAATM